MPKGAEATLNSEKIKPVVLAIIKLSLSEGIRQAVSQSVENSIELYFSKLCSNLLETFRVVLKALLGLVIHNQYCQGARMVL